MLELIVAIAVAVIVLAVVVVLAGRRSDRRWSEEEYERGKQAGTAGGNAMLTLRAMFEPGAEHALEQRMVEETDEATSGDPPDPAIGGEGERSR